MVDLNDYQENPTIKAIAEIKEVLLDAPTSEGQDALLEAVEDLTKPTDTQKISAVDLPLPTGAATLEKQNEQIEVLEDILTTLTSANESKFSNDSGTLATTLANANVEYLVVVFRVKAGQVSARIDDLMVSLNSVSNDDLLIRLGVNKTFSDATLNTRFQSVSAASKLEFARPGVNGAAASITVTGFGAGGRNVQSMQMKAQTDFTANGSTPITIPEGVLYSLTIIPRSSGGSVYDSESWAE